MGGSIPELLLLESVDASHGRVSPAGLALLVAHCPFLSDVALNYLPRDDGGGGGVTREEEEEDAGRWD